MRGEGDCVRVSIHTDIFMKKMYVYESVAGHSAALNFENPPPLARNTPRKDGHPDTIAQIRVFAGFPPHHRLTGGHCEAMLFSGRHLVFMRFFTAPNKTKPTGHFTQIQLS